jgi:hypothetical protein
MDLRAFKRHYIASYLSTAANICGNYAGVILVCRNPAGEGEGSRV